MPPLLLVQTKMEKIASFRQVGYIPSPNSSQSHWLWADHQSTHSLSFLLVLPSFISFIPALEPLGHHFHHFEANICNSLAHFSKHSLGASAFSPVVTNVWYPIPQPFCLSPNHPLGLSLIT